MQVRQFFFPLQLFTFFVQNNEYTKQMNANEAHLELIHYYALFFSFLVCNFPLTTFLLTCPFGSCLGFYFYQLHNQQLTTTASLDCESHLTTNFAPWLCDDSNTVFVSLQSSYGLSSFCFCQGYLKLVEFYCNVPFIPLQTFSLSPVYVYTF